MIRTQVSLTSGQMDRLRREAARRGVSMAELVREAVDRYVPEEKAARREARRRALSVAGRFSSGLRDLAERHDDYLGDLSRW